MLKRQMESWPTTISSTSAEVWSTVSRAGPAEFLLGGLSVQQTAWSKLGQTASFLPFTLSLLQSLAFGISSIQQGMKAESGRTHLSGKRSSARKSPSMFVQCPHQSWPGLPLPDFLGPSAPGVLRTRVASREREPPTSSHCFIQSLIHPTQIY